MVYKFSNCNQEISKLIVCIFMKTTTIYCRNMPRQRDIEFVEKGSFKYLYNRDWISDKMKQILVKLFKLKVIWTNFNFIF